MRNPLIRDDPLIGPKLKVERANAHIQESSALIKAFLGTHPYEVVEEKKANGATLIKARFTKKPPSEIAVIGGEILYNLRSALDQLVTATATKQNVVVIERTGFPIEETRNKFEATLRERKIEDRLPELAKVLHQIQPYKRGNAERGNDVLWWLHRLNGAEKHKVLLVVVSAMVGGQHSWKGTHYPIERTHTLGREVVFAGLRRPVNEEVEIATVAPGVEFESKSELVLDVILGDIDGPELYSVTPSFQQFSDVVKGIINIFENRFFNRVILQR